MKILQSSVVYKVNDDYLQKTKEKRNRKIQIYGDNERNIYNKSVCCFTRWLLKNDPIIPITYKC